MSFKHDVDQLFDNPERLASRWKDEFGASRYRLLLQILYRLIVEGLPVPDHLTTSTSEIYRILPELLWVCDRDHWGIECLEIHLIDEVSYTAKLIRGYKCESSEFSPIPGTINGVCELVRRFRDRQLEILRSEV
jgi:hypothetical protein